MKYRIGRPDSGQWLLVNTKHPTVGVEVTNDPDKALFEADSDKEAWEMGRANWRSPDDLFLLEKQMRIPACKLISGSHIYSRVEDKIGEQIIYVRVACGWSGNSWPDEMAR